jgi:hypothetical protein
LHYSVQFVTLFHFINTWRLGPSICSIWTSCSGILSWSWIHSWISNVDTRGLFGSNTQVSVFCRSVMSVVTNCFTSHLLHTYTKTNSNTTYLHNRSTSVHETTSPFSSQRQTVSEIWTHYLSRRTAADLRLRPRGNWERRIRN